MIRLKEKPTSCESCPFACAVEKFVRENGDIRSFNLYRCGVNMSTADINNCPIGQI